MARKIKTGDQIITVSKGELKVYQAKPRTLEAEAGLKEYEVKLDLIQAEDYIAAHKRLGDIVSDDAGQFRNSDRAGGDFTPKSVGEDHKLEEEIEARILREIAEDIETIASKSNAPLFLTVPEPIEKELLSLLKESTAERIIKTVPKDYVKIDKETLLERINEA